MNSTNITGKSSTRRRRIRKMHSKNRTRRKTEVATVAGITKSAKMTRNHLRKRDQNVKKIESLLKGPIMKWNSKSF